jgi:hypothetical protein
MFWFFTLIVLLGLVRSATTLDARYSMPCCSCLFRIPLLGGCFRRCCGPAEDEAAGLNDIGRPLDLSRNDSFNNGSIAGSSPKSLGHTGSFNSSFGGKRRGAESADGNSDEIMLTPTRRRGVSFARIERCTGPRNVPDEEGKYRPIRKVVSDYSPTGRVDDDELL